MNDDPQHVILPIFYNHRGTIIFRDRPIKVKPKPTRMQSILGWVNPKSLPQEEKVYLEHFYYAFEFNPKKQKLMNVLMGNIFDYLHSRGVTFNYPGVDQDSVAEYWVGRRRYHVVAVMADVRNPYLCGYGYLDASTRAFIEDDNEKRHHSKTKAPSFSIATVKDMIRQDELDEANIHLTSIAI
ncbi:hypothetical protein JCM25156A_11110 [Komagataeibacter kakiaceti JCM 25156]